MLAVEKSAFFLVLFCLLSAIYQLKRLINSKFCLLVTKSSWMALLGEIKS